MVTPTSKWGAQDGEPVEEGAPAAPRGGPVEEGAQGELGEQGAQGELGELGED